jgi:predicted  nucleic acid-binding Zn-ribbon protein
VKIEATLKDVRALLNLAEADRASDRRAAAPERPHRAGLARCVPRRLLDAYELLVEAGRVPAFVAVERGACSGCHMRLPTMLEYKARTSVAVHVCPCCRRLLYSPALVTAQAAGAAEVIAPSAEAPSSRGRR